MKISRQRIVVVLLLGLAAGCSKSEPQASSTPVTSRTSTAQSAVAEADVLITGKSVLALTPAGEAVSLFLENLRKGDAAQTRAWLTAEAQAEIDRRGLKIDPIGSSESNFNVGQTKYLDKAEDAAYVECVWTEPAGDGNTISTDVVFTVYLEEQGWRISGLAIDMGPEQAPAIVNFENMAGAVSTPPTAQQAVAQEQQAVQQATQSGLSMPPQVAQPQSNVANPMR